MNLLTDTKLAVTVSVAGERTEVEAAAAGAIQKKPKKKKRCNSILTSVRLGFSAGCAYSSQI